MFVPLAVPPGHFRDATQPHHHLKVRHKAGLKKIMELGSGKLPGIQTSLDKGTVMFSEQHSNTQ